MQCTSLTSLTSLASAHLLAFTLISGCTQAEHRVDSRASDYTPPKDVVETLVLDVSKKYQMITGFGASSAWTAPVLDQKVADFFFSEKNGIGLSLLRIQIKPEGNTTELATVDLAASYGVGVWAAPWSPPGEWKSTGQTAGGGELLDKFYQDWADRLANFALTMQQRGTPLIAVSAQNEPDYEPAWDSCFFSPEQLADFVGDHLGPALSHRKVSARVLAPEVANWNTLEEYGKALLNHPTAPSYLFALATHGYSGSAWDFTEARDAGLDLWLTEVSEEGNGADPGMKSALLLANQMLTDLTVAHVSAWHYWWLIPRGDTPDTNAALFDPDMQPTRRAFAMGQVSKFVRPGYVRIESTVQPAIGVQSAAFVSPDEQRLVLVIVNSRSKVIQQPIAVPGLTSATQLWLTDKDHALEKVPLAGGAQDLQLLSLPAASVTTLVLDYGVISTGQGGFSQSPEGGGAGLQETGVQEAASQLGGRNGH